MKLKTLAAVAVLALGTSSAYATDIVFDFGAVPSAPDIAYNLFDHPDVGVFTDTATFSIGAGDLSSSANPLNVMLGGENVSNIDGLEYTIWSGATAMGTFAGNNTTWTQSLAAGDYVVKITGNANGSSGGSYGLAMSLVPIPEPETYAMLLAGLGLIGFAARRRSTNEKFS